MTETKIIDVEDNRQKSIDIAEEVLCSNGIIIFPTETVYGIGCRLADTDAMERLFTLKRRPYDKPLSAYISDPEQVNLISENVSNTFYKLAEKFLPGPLALVLEAKPDLPDFVTDRGKTISIRYPDNEFILNVINRVGLIAGTSANISGEGSGKILDELSSPFEGKIGAAFRDDGHIGGIESTIISIVEDKPRILRLGAIEIENIEEVLGYKLNK